MALIALLTLLPINLVIRERPRPRGKVVARMDRSLLADTPFLLMLAGMLDGT